MQESRPSSSNNRENFEIHSPTNASPPSAEEYEPRFKQHQEDLRYMFGINVTDEHELSSSVIKKGMHDIALEHIKDGNPFSLDYFINEGLLDKEDFTDEDIVQMKPYALQLIKNIRNVAIKKNTKKLFSDVGILTNEEADISPTIH